MICWSGGKRGSGLYIVASHGASPSGRFSAVRGRSGSPDLVPGRCVGEVGVPALVVEDGFRAVGVVFRTVDGAEEGVAMFDKPFGLVGDDLESDGIPLPFDCVTGVSFTSSSRG